MKWERVYLFISSTFNDMHAERDCLLKRVLPRIRDWCEKRKLRLVDIDLRWGLTESDLESRKIVQLCLEYIDKSRPFFMCFQGQRYGWVPSKEDIAPETFKLFPELEQSVEAKNSVTEMEIIHGVVKSYGGDHEPCKQTFFYFRDPSYVQDLPAEPPMLKTIYNDPEGSEAAEKLNELKYEIIGQTGLPVRHYTAKWNPDDRTPELSIPLECSATLKDQQKGWRTDWKRQADVNIPDDALVIPDSEKGKAEAYNALLTKGRLGGFECGARSLEDVIFDDFTGAIAAQFPDHHEVTEESALRKELDQQEEFIYAASESFIERGDDFADLDAYVDGDSRKMMVLVAEAGMGKSTLLANWVDRRRADGRSVLARFVGMSDRSHTVQNVIRYLLEELKARGKIEGEISLDPQEVRESWNELMAGEEKKNSALKWKDRNPIVIVVDALNQLHSGLRDLYWLPREVPEHLKFVVSFKLGEEAGDKLYEKYKERGNFELAQVCPFESMEDRKALVQVFLRQYLKELDDIHIQTIIETEGAQNPLFLKIVLSELRIFGSFGQLAEKIKSDFGYSPSSAFKSVLKRLENDPAHSPLAPYRAVPLLFGLISHARYGLSIEEISGIFVNEWTNIGGEGAITVDKAQDTVELYLRQMKPFMARRDGRYDFFYESLLIASREKYAGVREAKAWHEFISGYFLSRQDTCLRKLSELPYHLSHAGRDEDVLRTLTSLEFIQSKSEHGMIDDLAEDFDRALGGLEEWAGIKQNARSETGDKHGVNRETIRLLSRALEMDFQFLQKHPHCLFQTLWNYGYWHDCPEAGQHYSTLRETGELPWVTDKNKLFYLVEHWRKQRKARAPWLKSSRPLPHRLDSSLKKIFRGHQKGVRSVCSNAQGTQVASASLDGTLRVWDVATATCIFVFSDHKDQVNSVCYRPDGLHIASGSNDATVRIWDTITGRCVCVFPDRSDKVNDLCYSPDGAFLALALNNKTIVICNAESGKTLKTLSGHNKSVTGVCYSPDGERLASVSLDGTARIWDVRSGVCQQVMGDEKTPLSSVDYNPDGIRIVYGAGDKTVRIWDTEHKICLHALTGHRFRVQKVRFSRNGNAVFSGSDDTKIYMWDAQTGECLHILHGHEKDIYGLWITSDNLHIVSGSFDGTVRIWEVREILSSPGIVEDMRMITGLAHNDQGTLIATHHLDEIIRVWDTADGVCVRKWKGEEGKPKIPTAFPGYAKGLSNLCFHPDNNRIASGFINATIQIWGVHTNDKLCTLAGHTKWVKQVLYSPDGKILASGSDDKTVRLWDPTRGACLRILEGHSWPLTDLCFSPDGRRLASASMDQTARIWRVEDGQILYILEGHDDFVNAVSFSPDGENLATCSNDRTIRVWNSNGECVRILKGHREQVNRVSYSADGVCLFTSSKDKETRIWDVVSGECREVMAGQSDTDSLNSSFYYVLGQDAELVVRNRTSPKILARFPSFIDESIFLPSRKIVVGYAGHDLYMLCLEGV